MGTNKTNSKNLNHEVEGNKPTDNSSFLVVGLLVI